MADYFELDIGPYQAEDWTLDYLFDAVGREIDARQFTYGDRIQLDPSLRLSLWNEDRIIEVVPPLEMTERTSGNYLDFTFTSDAMPVVTAAVAELIVSVAGSDVQAIPVKVRGKAEPFFILNVASRIRCIDTSRSEIQWGPENTGEPEMIAKLIIDREAVGDHHMFRVEQWDVAVIVSDILKTALERAKVSGIAFRKV